MQENQPNKKDCQTTHPMYDTLICENPEGHEGSHKAFYQGESLRWGIPSQQEMYNAKRTNK